MRFIKLDPYDFELFSFNLDYKKSVYFHKHSSLFRNMFEKQGQTFWLRYLLTFQLNVDKYFSENPDEWGYVFDFYGDEIMNSVCINIHKCFLESPCNISQKFIENIFKMTKKFDSKNQKSINNWDDKKTNMIYDMLGSLPVAIEPEAINLSNILYYGFASGICTLLERWQEASDLCEKTTKAIDYTLYYWKPLNLWLDKSFSPSCFEKYLARHWKEKLPKMLLTVNIHEVFDNHLVRNNCCSRYTLHKAVFRQNQNVAASRKPSLRVSKILSPVILFCKTHNDCYIKIQHDATCLEPYLCLGSVACLVTCETACKTKKSEQVLKNTSVEVSEVKKNLRDVSTCVESYDRHIETYYPFEDVDTSVSLCMEDFVCFNNDPHFKNFVSQQRKREEYRKKLRKKLLFKDDYNVHDPLQLKLMYDEAERLWAQELCAESLKNLFKNSPVNYDKKGMFEKTLFRRALTSVATGTNDIVFGRVVSSSKEKQSLSKNASFKTQGEFVKKTKGRSFINTKTDHTFSNSKSLTLKPEESSIGSCVKITSEEVSLDRIKKTNLCRGIEPTTTNLGKHPLCFQTNKQNLLKNDQQQTNSSILTNKANLPSLKNILHHVSAAHSSGVVTNEVNSPKFKKSLDVKKGAVENILETKSDEELETLCNFVSMNEVKLDSPAETDFKSSGGLRHPAEESREEMVPKKSKLKTCAFCFKKEIENKTFKRCSRCKAENLLDQYYYCSRECQVADWEKSHKEMHAKRNINI